MRTFLIIFAFALVTVVSILGFRGGTSGNPPLEVFPDMDRQPYLQAQASSRFFADGRADRLPVDGTVARGTFHADSYFASGMMSGEDGKKVWGRGFPASVTIDSETIGRGKEQYELFCQVCHGATGNGKGVTSGFGMIATPSYHSDLYREMPEGQIFDVITNGKNWTAIGGMGPYKAKIPPEDRWAIVLYLRALQESQASGASAVPAENREELGL